MLDHNKITLFLFNKSSFSIIGRPQPTAVKVNSQSGTVVLPQSTSVQSLGISFITLVMRDSDGGQEGIQAKIVLGGTKTIYRRSMSGQQKGDPLSSNQIDAGSITVLGRGKSETRLVTKHFHGVFSCSYLWFISVFCKLTVSSGAQLGIKRKIITDWKEESLYRWWCWWKYSKPRAFRQPATFCFLTYLCAHSPLPRLVPVPLFIPLECGDPKAIRGPRLNKNMS